MTTLRKSFASVMTRAANDRTFNVVISTGSVDRDGDTIDPAGWQLDNYRAAPVVLFQHDRTRPPIARATEVRVQGGKLLAKVEFPPSGISPLADEVAGLMQAGFLHSTSVGFLPIEWTPNGHGGKHITSAELLEFSIVSVPSQVEARVMRCAGQPCDAAAIKAWLSRVQDQAEVIGRGVSEAVAASFRRPNTPWIWHEGDEVIPPPDPAIARDEDEAVLILHDERVPPAARRAGREAGRLAQKAVQHSMDSPVLMIEDTFDVDERVVAAGVRAAVGAWMAATVAIEIRKAIAYQQGKITF